MKDLRELVLWQKHLLFVLAAAFEEKEESEQEEGFNSRLVGFDKTIVKQESRDNKTTNIKSNLCILTYSV